MASGNIPAPCMIVQINNDSSSVTVEANTNEDIDINLTSQLPDGYSIGAINTLSINGSGNANFVMRGFTISNAQKKVIARVRNISGSSSSCYIRCYALCFPTAIYGS